MTVSSLRLAAPLLAVLAIAGAVSDARARECRQTAVEALSSAAPDGWAIYHDIGDKSFFLNWIDCGDAQYSLPTAVHESTHYITAEHDAFPLVGGGEMPRPHEVSRFYPPSRIAAQFEAGDFVTTYLRHGASSATDLLYLLDELNAYSHDLNAAVDLKELRASHETVDHRDGLAALMAFVAVYVETAEATQPATWEGLQEPRVAHTVAALWSQAEHVMASSCGIPDFGADDRTYIGRFCAAAPRSSLRTIIGREPVCPMACLDATASAAVERVETTTPSADERVVEPSQVP